jgi:serine/threonine-protein kinase
MAPGAPADPPPRRVRFGPFEADFDAGELRKHGRRVRLQDQPLKILAVLCERAGRPVTREELRDRLWPADTFVDFEHGLNTAVKRLRDVLGDAADRPTYVETLPRRGYRLIAPVEVVAAVLTDEIAATEREASPERRIDVTRMEWPAVRPVALLVGVCAVLLAAWTLDVGLRPRASTAVRHLAIELPDQGLNEQQTPFALSHDGTTLVFAAGSFQGARLFVRSLDDPGTTRLVGEVSARSPAFSPDDRWVAFAVDDDTTLRKVRVSGGPGVILARTHGFVTGGLDWGAGAIYFSAGALSGSGISRVAETGGTPEAVTTPDARRGEIAHVFPQVLPGGRNLLFTVKGGEGGEADQVVVQSLVTGARRVILHGASGARYLTSGHLLYAQGPDLLAAPFHLERLAIAGTPGVVVRGFSTGSLDESPRFAAAEDGTLVYVPPRRSDERRLVWVDRSGTESPLGAPPNSYSFPALSPNGARIAVKVTETGVAARTGDVWIYEPDADLLRQLTFSGAVLNAIWTPDGAAVTYSMPGARTFAMVRHSTTGDQRTETLFSRGLGLWPGSWTPDGRTLCYMEATAAGTGGDLSIFETGPAARHRPLLTTTSTEWGGQISPDGQWMAYISNQSGRWEVYVRSFTGAGAAVQVSRDGGTEVVWAPTGRELFYRQSDAVLVVPVRSTPALAVGKPRRLFSGPYTSVLPGVANYDVAPDASRLLMIRAGPAETTPRALRVVLNWPGRVDRLSR